MKEKWLEDKIFCGPIHYCLKHFYGDSREVDVKIVPVKSAYEVKPLHVFGRKLLYRDETNWRICEKCAIRGSSQALSSTENPILRNTEKARVAMPISHQLPFASRSAPRKKGALNLVCSDTSVSKVGTKNMSSNAGSVKQVLKSGACRLGLKFQNYLLYLWKKIPVDI